MSLANDLLTYLAAQSTAFTILSGTAGNLSFMDMPDGGSAPDTLTTIYETAGVANSYVMSTSTGSADVAFEQPSFQILCRSTTFNTARTNAQTAYTILDGLSQTSLPTSTGTLYLDITANQAPFFLQRDDNRRFIVACNYTARKQVG